MFSYRLKELRNRKSGLTQAKLAEIMNVSQQAVGLWERGKNMPSHELVTKLASFFNVSVDYLLGRTDEPQGTGFQKGDNGGSQNDGEIKQPMMTKAYTGYSQTTYHDPLLSELIEQYPKLNDTAKAAINSILALAKAQQTKSGVTTAERIGNKILDASPEAQSAVNDIIRNDKK